ncbi:MULTISPECIES: GntR family transcriptional regulator [unclassified Gilliamella]|uniref:GntR family transcriptional regulator n=1 Tax=unclassified Gilliamella TaxID=2685620 RepID=UPI001C6A75AA|nr:MULTISPECIES: GntR family transcriptional regulator [unclassified Gilliamella]MCX8601229.1 GntR family transcriptional regulator [Gilliamella sp. B3722]MCX8607383.1 GntR family transcriptional regulator [Gilliamella sp. B3771]MCX8610428.1 GntR family transcriptional regulator [Gilliamella sp. B3891]MCX8612903.1 GntR family transcriptional regulator [Gilliamella sp. B3773]MCX8614812.1 GntR family transcriptional regulator [Gilliamella sp. B3770]
MLTVNRLYREIGNELKSLLKSGTYKIGDRLPPERDIAETFNVSRTVVREALIMLELENLVTVKKGSGVYVIGLPDDELSEKDKKLEEEDYGPFELLQARQLIESNIAAFAASQIVKSDIVELRAILEQERKILEQGILDDYSADEMFHIAIAKATKNSILEGLLNDLWQKRYASKMWDQLHSRITDHSYRKKWLYDHEKILQALQVKDAMAARHAMWQHLENVKQTLMTVSDSEDPNFDGYLFDSIPVTIVNQ